MSNVFQRYREKAPIVEAVQVTRDNVQAVAADVKSVGGFLFFNDDSFLLIDSHDRPFKKTAFGAWIIGGKNVGDFLIASDSNFSKKYEAAPKALLS